MTYKLYENRYQVHVFTKVVKCQYYYKDWDFIVFTVLSYYCLINQWLAAYDNFFLSYFYRIYLYLYYTYTIPTHFYQLPYTFVGVNQINLGHVSRLNQYQPGSISINQYQPGSIRLNQAQSGFAGFAGSIRLNQALQARVDPCPATKYPWHLCSSYRCRCLGVPM